MNALAHPREAHKEDHNSLVGQQLLAQGYCTKKAYMHECTTMLQKYSMHPECCWTQSGDSFSKSIRQETSTHIIAYDIKKHTGRYGHTPDTTLAFHNTLMLATEHPDCKHLFWLRASNILAKQHPKCSIQESGRTRKAENTMDESCRLQPMLKCRPHSCACQCTLLEAAMH